ncbi:hypothetical protein ACFFSZ_08500 [Streptomyces violaceus]
MTEHLSTQLMRAVLIEVPVREHADKYRHSAGSVLLSEFHGGLHTLTLLTDRFFLLPFLVVPAVLILSPVTSGFLRVRHMPPLVNYCLCRLSPPK